METRDPDVPFTPPSSRPAVGLGQCSSSAHGVFPLCTQEAPHGLIVFSRGRLTEDSTWACIPAA